MLSNSFGWNFRGRTQTLFKRDENMQKEETEGGVSGGMTGYERAKG